LQYKCFDFEGSDIAIVCSDCGDTVLYCIVLQSVQILSVYIFKHKCLDIKCLDIAIRCSDFRDIVLNCIVLQSVSILSVYKLQYKCLDIDCLDIAIVCSDCGDTVLYCISRPKSFLKAGFRPLCPPFVYFVPLSRTKPAFWISTRTAKGPSSQVLPGCRVRQPHIPRSFSCGIAKSLDIECVDVAIQVVRC